MSNPYSCTPKYLKEINDPYLTWSLISSSNIQYDNFYTYFDTSIGTYCIKSNTNNQFKAPIIFLDDGTNNFKINSIDYDKIQSGIKNGMTFIYKEGYTPNPDTWTYTWYEVENTSIKIIPNIDCPIKPTPTPTPDMSMLCNPKCSQLLPQPYNRWCEPTLFFDKNYKEKWSIITQEGKLYSDLDIRYDYDNNYYFVELSSKEDESFQVNLHMQNLQGEISFGVISIVDTDQIKTGILVGDGFLYDIDTGSYQCIRYIDNKLTYVGIKILPTVCLSVQKYDKCENKK